MRAIYGTLLVFGLAAGFYFLLKDPRWMMESGRMTALGIGAVFGYLLGRFVS